MRDELLEVLADEIVQDLGAFDAAVAQLLELALGVLVGQPVVDLDLARRAAVGELVRRLNTDFGVVEVELAHHLGGRALFLGNRDGVVEVLDILRERYTGHKQVCEKGQVVDKC